MLGDHGGERHPLDRVLTGQHEIANQPQRKHIGPGIHRAFAQCLFRGHVARGADDLAAVGEGGVRPLQRLRDPEVRDQRAPRAAVEQYVVRFDVAMDHALRVGIGQRLGHFLEHAAGHRHGLRAFALHLGPDALPFH